MNVQAKVVQPTDMGFSPSEEQEGPLEPEDLRPKWPVLPGPSSSLLPAQSELEA